MRFDFNLLVDELHNAKLVSDATGMQRSMGLTYYFKSYTRVTMKEVMDLYVNGMDGGYRERLFIDHLNKTETNVRGLLLVDLKRRHEIVALLKTFEGHLTMIRDIRRLARYITKPGNIHAAAMLEMLTSPDKRTEYFVEFASRVKGEITDSLMKANEFAQF